MPKDETLLEVARRLYEEDEEQFDSWFAALSAEEKKELWVQYIEATLEILIKMVRR